MTDTNMAGVGATVPVAPATIAFPRTPAMAWSAAVVALGILVASAYGLLAADA